LTLNIGKSGTFGNIFFVEYGHLNLLKINALRFWVVFAHIQDSRKVRMQGHLTLF